MNARLQAQERDRRGEAVAVDLLEHPGWADVIKDVIREAKAARTVLLSGNEELTESQRAHARGSFAVLKNIVTEVYRRANKEVPANIAALFE